MTAPAQEEQPPPTAPELHQQWRDEYEISLKQHTEKKLVLMLAAIQARLGTSEESLGDVDRCNGIVDRLKDMQTGQQLGEGLKKMEPKRSLS